MPTIRTKDSTEIYYNDWGIGQPIVFSHGWPVTGDAFEDQMFFLADHGYRVIAHDRRGHGRSGKPSHGNDMDTYADDLAELAAALNISRAITSHIPPAGAKSRATSLVMGPPACQKPC